MKALVLILCIIFLYTDVYFFLKYRQAYLNNKFAVWSDARNTDRDNQWVGRIEPEKYQAILPLPMYHMGSDNYYILARCRMMAWSFQVSMKTGLPVTAIYLSRASISQSIKNIALVLEPYRELKILEDLPDKRPFLIVAARCDEYTPEENNLLHFATRIDSNSYFDLYRLEYDSLSALPKRKSAEIVKEFANYPVQNRDSVYITDKTASVEILSYETTGLPRGYQGNALQLKGRSPSVLFDNVVPVGSDSLYTLSFWFSPIDKDLLPKTRLEIELFNDQGAKYAYKNEMVGKLLKTVDGTWGLIEWQIPLVRPFSRIRIVVYNTQIPKKQTYRIDELLIRPGHCDVYQARGNSISRNNRWFLANPLSETPQ